MASILERIGSHLLPVESDPWKHNPLEFLAGENG
jgi:hypothetical protein